MERWITNSDIKPFALLNYPFKNISLIGLQPQYDLIFKFWILRHDFFCRTDSDGIDIGTLKIGGKLSPKILVVAPDKRLSWQYHHRRAEIWKVVNGTVGVIMSDTDKEGELKSYKPGDQITLKKGERHRLVGLKEWGTVAEIWQHTDANNPSDEDDIVRVQDDFGR